MLFLFLKKLSPSLHRFSLFSCFLFLLLTPATPLFADSFDPGWRLSLIPSFERPKLSEPIPGSHTSLIAATRTNQFGETEFATTQSAWNYAVQAAKEFGNDWINNAKVDIRRDSDRVINRIIISSDTQSITHLPLSPAFYLHFEPILGDGFYVVVPDRNTLVLYPRIAGGIPQNEITRLLEIIFVADHPVTREVFRSTAQGLVADGILED